MKREINGILLVDKPVGLSSNQVLQKAKRIYHAVKAGHTGSLDPLASGMLPICFGEATKFSQYLLDASKYYTAIAQLGITTTTGDAEGEITAEQPVPKLTSAQLKKITQQFIGHIEQLPPMFSALKYQGQPLYRLARKGISIERQTRQVKIYTLILQQISANTISLTVHCSKGTYIRSLAEDIGRQIGCGATIQQLRRLWVTPYQQQPMYTLDELHALAENFDEQALDSKLLPIDSAIQHFPMLTVDNLCLLKIQQGQAVQVDEKINIEDDQTLVRIYCGNSFVGLGNLAQNHLLKAQRMLKICC